MRLCVVVFTESAIKQATTKQHMYIDILLIDIQVSLSLLELLHMRLHVPSAVAAYSLVTFHMELFSRC